jgi:SET domain-containing protein
MVFNNNFEIRSSKFGKGLFATQQIPANTLICSVTGSIINFKETLLLGSKESHCLQIEKDKYILCNPPFLYSNHSCDPNCAINSKLQLYTIKDIEANKELLWDYSTSMLERHWTMQCFCGADNCRNIITDFDLLPQELQYEYLKRNLVLPFIYQHLQSSSKPHIRRA